MDDNNLNIVKSSSDSGLMYRLCMTAALIFGVFLAILQAWGSLTASTGSRLFAAIMVILIILAGSCAILSGKVFYSKRIDSAACVILIFALFLRLCMFDHKSGDYNGFLSIWTQTMEQMSLREALITPIGDYNMPYLYALLLISRLPFYDLYCIKLLSVAADVAAALAIAKLAGLMTKRSSVILAAYTAALLAPTTWLNSAYWGQCDSVYGAFALWGLYCGLTKRPKWSMVLFALSLAFKLQAIFILPICVFLLVTDRAKLREALIFPVSFFLLMLPALLAGRSFADTFSIYMNQTQAYPYLSLNAPSFWSLIPNDYFNELAGAPVMLAMIGALLILWVFLRKYDRLSTTDLIVIALLFSLAIPWLLPRMHERYFYLAEMLSILWAVHRPKGLPVPIILLGGGQLIYSAYLFGWVPILSLQYIAVIYGLTLLYLLIRCIGQLYTNTNANLS